LHGDGLPWIVRLEQLSGFLSRRIPIDRFDGADPFCRRMLRISQDDLVAGRGLARFGNGISSPEKRAGKARGREAAG
jgi:hypothetical protein